MNELRRTKIVATLGPSTDDQSALVAMIRAGVDGVRINCSHGTKNEWLRRAWMAREKVCNCRPCLDAPHERPLATLTSGTVRSEEPASTANDFPKPFAQG